MPTEESRQCDAHPHSPLQNMGDGMYVSSPEETDKMIPNRLHDFYINESKCEFDQCQETAIHHCCDATLYWEGCGRVFCEKHAKAAKGDDDLESLAFICAECHAR